VGFERDLLLENKDFAQSIVNGVSAETLKLCLAKHGDDETFLMFSLLNEYLEWSMIPEVFQADVTFVVKSSREHSLVSCKTVGSLPRWK